MAEESTGKTGDLLERIPWYTVPSILIGVPVLMAILSLLSPDFYTHVVWQYYWGPIAADAAPGDVLYRDGVSAHAGYNVVNTASWAVLLGLCLIGLSQMLNRLRQPMDNKMILGATAWVVTGAVWHVLQDSKLIQQPLEYFFITPPIYLLFALFGVISLLYGHYAKHVTARTGSLEQGLQKIWFLFMVVVLGYTFLWLAEWDQVVVYVNPVWVALFAILTFAVVRWRVARLGRIEPSEMTMIFSIGWFLLSMAYVWSYIQEPWPGRFPDDDLQYAFLIAPALAAAVTGVVFLVARALKQRGKEGAAAYLMPINLVLVFSQMVDAFATSLGIDLSNYREKHILSEAVRKVTEGLGGFFEKYPTFLGFAPVKLAVSLLVVYAIDVSSKDDVKRYPTLIGLVKFAIIMVGVGPGVRNMTRMSLGI